MIYLDHNATTQPAPEVLDEMHDALERAWANPSSTHAPGQAARRLLADARVRVAQFLGCQGAELVFTSGATEANHMAVTGALALGRQAGESDGLPGRPPRHRLVLSAVEHPALLALAARLADQGVPVDLLPVDACGRLDLARARALITPDVALVSVMGANNETGVLMPIAELAALAHAAGALLHMDATQLPGKSRWRFADSGADLASVSAHKLHGPKGVGALIVRKGLALPALLAGRQERNRRGGTENMPGIAGFAAACDRTARSLADDLAHMTALRQRLEDGLRAALPGVVVYGDQAHRLPNTSCLRFGALDSEQVLGKLERAGVVASSGAACTASGTQPSHVLLAMGESAQHAKASVRFSLGRETTSADVQRAIDAARRAIGPLLAPAATTAFPARFMAA
ncbi:MAG: cysteine desulfurase family protein [Burkholderiaceae bacterium]|nr:cysteine desulfurase family protein [Burkholderiaceae bacterium]